LTFVQDGTQGESALRAALLQGPDPELQLSDAEFQTVAYADEIGTITMDNLEIRANLGFHPVLRVDYFPGMALVICGLVAALLALLVGWLAGPHLVWIAVVSESERSNVRLLNRPSARGSRYLPRLATLLHEALGHDT
jgi:hypothetical protein